MTINTRIQTVLFITACFSGTVNGALVDGVSLQFVPATTGGTTQPVSGSWWGADVTSATVYTPLVPHDGLVLGSAQPATGSHSGPPDGSENPTITEPWISFGSTGMHHSVSPITVINASGNTATLDFSGFSIAWNGIPNISLGGDPANFPNELGIAAVVCGIDCGIGDTFVLNYAAHEVPEIGGQLHTLHLEGTIVQIPDGDINNDGQVNAADLLLAMRILTGLHTPTAGEQNRWDVAPLVGGVPQPDTQNTLADYVVLLRKVEGIISF